MRVFSYHRYVAWQVHERVEGQYDFEGDNDLVHFTQLAALLDLLVIIRAGKLKQMILTLIYIVTGHTICNGR